MHTQYVWLYTWMFCNKYKTFTYIWFGEHHGGNQVQNSRSDPGKRASIAQEAGKTWEVVCIPLAQNISSQRDEFKVEADQRLQVFPGFKKS